MNLLKTGMSALLCLGLTVSCTKDDDPTVPTITNLDFTIEASSLGNIVSVTPSATGATSYSVDFGTDATDDVLPTSGPKVTYTYPSEAATYEITVTASATGADDVTKTKSYNVVINIPQTDVIGRWVLDHSASSLYLGSAAGQYWWSNTLVDVTTRACLYDDVYEFKTDGSFNNIDGGSTWLEPWHGTVEKEGCGTPVAPYDGKATATWFHDEAEGTLKLNGKGAYLGLSKVTDGSEISGPTAAVESIKYSNVTISEDKNTLTVEAHYNTLDGNAAIWKFTLAREGSAGASVPQTDTDGDGVIDAEDACPELAGTTANGCPAVAKPTVGATAPTLDAGSVASIYSDEYTYVANTDYNPGWGQTTQFEEIDLSGDNVLQYSQLNYQGTTFDAIDLASYTHIHFDINSSEVDKLKITLIDTGEDDVDDTFEVGVDKTLTSGEWTSLDIPLSEFTGLVASGKIDQLKYEVGTDGVATGTRSFYVDNIYLY